jgi:hypothetical protein
MMTTPRTQDFVDHYLQWEQQGFGPDQIRKLLEEEYGSYPPNLGDLVRQEKRKSHASFRERVTDRYAIAKAETVFEKRFRKAARQSWVYQRWKTETGNDDYGKEEYYGFVESFLDDFSIYADVRGSSVTAYRILILDDIDEFVKNLKSTNPKSLGHSWTWHQGAVWPVDGLGDPDKAWVAVARVPEAIVDFGHTLILNAQFPHERELRLGAGNVKVLKVYKFKDEKRSVTFTRPLTVRS